MWPGGEEGCEARVVAAERVGGPDEPEPPTLRRTAPFLYLRLRRHDYTSDEIDTWADRLAPFLAAGDDVFVFFRHDEVGRGPELALELTAAVVARGGSTAE